MQVTDCLNQNIFLTKCIPEISWHLKVQYVILGF